MYATFPVSRALHTDGAEVSRTLLAGSWEVHLAVRTGGASAFTLESLHGSCPCRVSVTLSQTSLTLTSGVSHSRNALRYSCIYLLYNNYYGNPGTRPFSILRHAGCPQLQCSLPEVAGGRGNLLHVLPVHTGGQPRAARRGGSLGGHVLDSFWEGRTWRRFGKDVHGAEDSVL